MPTKNWDLLTTGLTETNVDAFAPYADVSSELNYLRLLSQSTRASTAKKNAINHAFSMAEYYENQGMFALACDWLVAGAEQAESNEEFIPRLLEHFSRLSGGQSQSWAELFRSPPSELGRPLLAVTSLRVLIAANFSCDRSVETHILDFFRASLPDVCKGMQVSEKHSRIEQLDKLRNVESKIDEVLQDLLDATDAPQIRAVLNRFPRILHCVSQVVVKGITSPYLPKGFVKSVLPQTMKSLEDLCSASLSQFVDTAAVAESEVTKALARLNECPSVYVRRYFLPFISKLSQLVQNECQNSDATKPAAIELIDYPRKYPFHQSGSPIRLRFIVANQGPGPGVDIEIAFFFLADFDITEKTVQLSSLEVGQQLIEFDVTSKSAIQSVEYQARITWTNFDGKSSEKQVDGVLGCQNANVNWDKLRSEEPYSMEAINLESARPFVGRDADLRKLMTAIVSESMGSAYIHGQKRVGKTSIGMELASRAQEIASHHFFPIYVEGGEYVEPRAEATVAELGKKLVRKISKCLPAFANVPKPEFTDSLTPLDGYIDDILETQPGARLLLVLDEFDELPIELYKRGTLGDSFFLKLRALSGKPGVGLILIGGEKIPLIVSAQGDQLNRFVPLAVDYFNKEDQWSDFQDLVRKPVEGAIEFSDVAIERLYSWSAGNPFFTNMVCHTILNDCHDRRDSYVTEFEVDNCARRTYSNAEQNSFQHFWEDGILDTSMKTEEISILRRKVFLAIASLLRKGEESTYEAVTKERVVADEQSAVIDGQLRQLVQRKILVDHSGGQLSCRVKLFERFLAERSATILSTEFTDAAERLRIEQIENETYVTSQELCDLLSSWGQYGPRPVNEEALRAWLNQFDSNQDQRLIFLLLQKLRFYNDQLVREKLALAMSAIRKKSTERKQMGERKRRDVLVTYLGDVGKSGAQYARLFCQVNDILTQNVLSPTDFVEKHRNNLCEYSAIVAIDDLLGTGGSVEESLDQVEERMGEQLRKAGVPLFIVAVCAFERAVERVHQKIKSLSLPIELFVCDILSDDDRAFSETSGIFENSADRLRAREISQDKGRLLEKKWPLGFGDCEALVTFFSNCPNNSLPILYKESNDWRALFPRQ